jgi:hypothetical protein
VAVQVALGQPHSAQPRKPLREADAQAAKLGVKEAQIELEIVADRKAAGELAEQRCGDVGEPWRGRHVAGAQAMEMGRADVAFGIDQRAERRHHSPAGIQAHHCRLHDAVGAW